MNILIILAFVEICTVLLALLSNSLFTFLIHLASSLHYLCRNILFLFSISMYLLTISHGLTIIEFLYEKGTYEYVYSISPRGVTWRIIHELAYALQSFSLVCFSIERLVSGIYPTAHKRRNTKTIFFSLCFIFVILSCAFSLTLHMSSFIFSATIAMNTVDLSGCIILLIAWRKSLKRYRTTIGVFSLEQRFQLSEVYTWSKHLIPAVLLASLTKFTVNVFIWIFISKKYDEKYAPFLLFAYNNILNIYTVILPIVILIKHHKIWKKLIHAKNRSLGEIRRTIDGKEIPSHYDYFEFLNRKWN